MRPEADALAQSLALELTALRSLLELLEEERGALLEHDADAVTRLAQAKRERLAAASDASALSRSQLLALNGPGPGRDHRGVPLQCATLFDAVADSWRRTVAANRRNGEVLKIHQASVLRGLAVLRHGAGHVDLYRADGRSAGHYLSA